MALQNTAKHSFGFFDGLKRKRDIRIKPKFSGGNTSFGCTPALKYTQKMSTLYTELKAGKKSQKMRDPLK